MLIYVFDYLVCAGDILVLSLHQQKNGRFKKPNDHN